VEVKKGWWFKRGKDRGGAKGGLIRVSKGGQRKAQKMELFSY